MAKKSPTARTLEELRDLGFTAQVVEKWIPQTKRRIDLYGVIDIVAMKPGVGILGVQATSGSNHANRRTKSMDEPRLLQWLESGGRFEIFSWTKKGKKDSRKLWSCRRDEITLSDFRTHRAQGE